MLDAKETRPISHPICFLMSLNTDTWLTLEQARQDTCEMCLMNGYTRLGTFTGVSVLETAPFQRWQVPREDGDHRWLRGRGGGKVTGEEDCDPGRQHFCGETVAAQTQGSAGASLSAGITAVLSSLKWCSVRSTTLQWPMLAENS